MPGYKRKKPQNKLYAREDGHESCQVKPREVEEKEAQEPKTPGDKNSGKLHKEEQGNKAPLAAPAKHQPM